MIISLSGYARSGKDTVADYLVKKHGFVRMAFADPIKAALYKINPNIAIGGTQGVSLAHAVDHFGWEELKEVSPEIRGMLQRLGTEFGRDMFGDDFWVDYSIGKSWQHDDVVFSDVRFKNEVQLITKNWGYNWRINRPGVGPVNDHKSEVDLDTYDNWDGIIDNEGSLKVLYSKVDLLLEESQG
jgi:hypothetical protein